jgi:hypothetical protein
MKFIIVLAALFSIALAAPASDATAVNRRVPAPCNCKPVFCPLEIVAVCFDVAYRDSIEKMLM